MSLVYRDHTHIFKLMGLILFFCLAGLISAIQVQAAQNFIIKGRVIDASTQAGIKAAAIQIVDYKGNTAALTQTSAGGTYLVIVKSFGRLYIQASMAGYASNVKNTNITRAGAYIFDFKLNKLPKNTPPVIDSISPVNLSMPEAGQTILIQAKASDQDKDPLQYRYFIDNKLLKDWSTASSYSLSTSLNDKGRHRIKVEVKDAKNPVVAKTSDIFIIVPFPKPG